MSKKKTLGQFFTTNYQYILQNMYIPQHISTIIEPFAGNGDLIDFITDKSKYTIECYDIDPKQDYIIMRDTLMNPPDYRNSFIISNPPYLARNKSVKKELFDLFDTNDLYKCFIKNIIENRCLGGILIVPLNFISSIRKADIELRRSFLLVYEIVLINIFEEQVFVDTKYTICCFQFSQHISNQENEIKCNIYPSKKIINFALNMNNNWTIGGEIYNLPQNKNITIERATNKTKNTDDITHILAKCIDDNLANKISLNIIDNIDKYIDNTPNLSARSYAILVITPKIDIEKQKELVQKFNTYFNKQREKYNSLFLTNYRESNDIARKRISFNLIYEICNYLLQE